MPVVDGGNAVQCRLLLLVRESAVFVFQTIGQLAQSVHGVLMSRGGRDVAGHPACVDALLDRFHQLLDAVTHHLEHFAASGRDGHVFVGPQGGQLRRSNFRDDWVKARKAAGVTAELHFHDLRHTGNTLASTAGASTRELMTRMWHSSSRAALIYQHMISDRDRAIADRLGAMIREGGGEETPG